MGLRTQKKRRRTGKTDYNLRLGLLKSGIPRIVVRKTNKYLIVQAVESKQAQDKVIVGMCSKELLNIGWDKKFKGSLKSLSAGYLTGLLFAKKIHELKIKNEFILDSGMIIHLKGNRIYALIRGLVEGGVNIKVNPEVFPSDERLTRENIKPELKELIAKIKSNIKGKPNG